jgi:transitional endoplasmic reticulum ATPase
MTSEQDPQRLIARTRHINAHQGVAYFELPNGNIIPYVMYEGENFTLGDVVLIGPQWTDVELAPRELWHEDPWVGTVRIVLDSEAVIDIGGRVRTLPLPEGLNLQAGYTVEGFETRGITRILAHDPIRYIDISIGDSVSAEQFILSDSGSSSFKDFGGYTQIVERAIDLIELPLEHHSKLAKIGARPIKGVLFTGPPGTGKTMLARIIAHRAKATFYQISGPQVLSKWQGQSEEVIRTIFEDAKSRDRSIIFFDEIDSLATQRHDESHEGSRSIVGQLLTSMDGFAPDANIVVIATTNRPGDIDEALRRPGRFDWQIDFPYPTRQDREDILRTSARSLNIGEELPHALIAEMTDSWTPADLAAIWSEAALLAVKDDRESLLQEDYFGGFQRVSAQRSLVANTRRAISKEEN